MQNTQHQNLVGFIWSIANKLRGPYRPPQYRRVMLPSDVPDQLSASISWCKSLHATICAYTGNKFRLHTTKFVFSNHEPAGSPYLDTGGKYLRRDHTIRHYRYAGLNGMALAELDNSNVEVIRLRGLSDFCLLKGGVA